ncbi:MAG: putative metal-binding motif-containing protein [Myxococcales bacterium]|nr:putative metal-binding motif-containing protein [Myxococcales bacterium]
MSPQQSSGAPQGEGGDRQGDAGAVNSDAPLPTEEPVGVASEDAGAPGSDRSGKGTLDAAMPITTPKRTPPEELPMCNTSNTLPGSDQCIRNWCPEEPCTPDPCPNNEDNDGDGFLAACCWQEGSGRACGLDCDDENDRVHAFRSEAADGIDNDCDGVVDEAAATGAAAPQSLCSFEFIGLWFVCEEPEEGNPYVDVPDVTTLEGCMTACLERNDCVAVSDWSWLGLGHGCSLYMGPCDTPRHEAWAEENGARMYRKLCE